MFVCTTPTIQSCLTAGGRGTPTTVAITPRTAVSSATPRGTPSTSPELADAKSEG